ncbi:acyl-CoA dehydrogenase family protein, partial [Jatrophihabitans endophyticus]|uniref:acyl-CoA dehydrogenase family protein n=1 Tax=Jatrophihabitans endophyticus TaxID=1206085 RepID=UPI0019FA085D
MDIALSKEERAFAERMRTFFTTEIPEEIRAKGARGEHATADDIRTSQRIMNEHGLAVPHWPTEWGGQDWTPIQRHLYAEEMLLAHVPPPLAFNTQMVGPVIATFGSQEIKERFLPKTASLEIWWSQGFSEPNAGSDLASLKTTAVRDGDSYIVNGQKTWTTLGQFGDWIFCLVRTDPDAKKQRGISFLLIDMTDPGVTVRPIHLIDGGYEVNEVFFEDVRVPAENLVGEENKGWDYAKFLLGNERTGVVAVGQTKSRIQRIKRLAAQTTNNGKPLMDDPLFRARLTKLEVELSAIEMSVLRVLDT